MENSATRRQERDRQNIESYKSKWQDLFLDEGYEGRWTLINGGTPHGTYSSLGDAEQAERQLQMEKPDSASTIIKIVRSEPYETS